jgi:hypothetical protein
MKDILDKYDGRAGMPPSRIVIHKTSQYQPEEEAGFRRAAAARIPVADLIWMRSTPFRLIRKGAQEPWRGTLCTLGDESYLFTSGYVPWWDEYPGPHIPASIQIGSCGETDLREHAREISCAHEDELEFNRRPGTPPDHDFFCPQSRKPDG